MLLRPLYLMMLGLSLLLTACQGGTRVIKDGFTARPANKSRHQQEVELLQQRVAQLEQQAETYLKAAQSAHDGHRAAVKYTADLQADHATLLGLVQEREYEIKRRIWAMHGSRMGHQLYGDDGRLDCNTCFRKYSDESLETVYGFELYDANVLCAKAASLPA